MPRKAAVASGNVDAERAPAHAYIIFEKRTSAVYALQLNMSEVSHLLMTPMAAGRVLHTEYNAHYLLTAAHAGQLTFQHLATSVRLPCVFMPAISTLHPPPGCPVLIWHIV